MLHHERLLLLTKHSFGQSLHFVSVDLVRMHQQMELSPFVDVAHLDQHFVDLQNHGQHLHLNLVELVLLVEQLVEQVVLELVPL